MAANGEGFHDDDRRGAVPLEIAVRAESAANHVRDDFREYRVEQAKTNEGLRALIANVDRRLSRVASDLATAQGEQLGESRMTRRWLAIAGLVVGALAAIEPLVHLIRAVGAR